MRENVGVGCRQGMKTAQKESWTQPCLKDTWTWQLHALIHFPFCLSWSEFILVSDVTLTPSMSQREAPRLATPWRPSPSTEEVMARLGLDGSIQ